MDVIRHLGARGSGGPALAALVLGLPMAVAVDLLAGLLLGVSAALAVLVALLLRQAVSDDTPAARSTIPQVLDALSHPVVLLDALGRVRHANPAVQRLLNLPLPVEEGTDPRRLFHALAGGDESRVEGQQLPWHRAREGSPVTDEPFQATLLDGSAVWLAITAHTIPSTAGDLVVVEFTDLTRRVTLDRESAAETATLRHKALHDSLTGLPNRALLLDRMARSSGRTTEDRGTALLMLDLDGFKSINDTLGHAVGDEILVQVAVRLRLALRERDLAARLGGDEFVILCEDLHPAIMQLEMARIMRRVDMGLAEPFLTSAGVLQIRASIGWAVAGPGEELDLELLERADEMMLDQKRGRSGVRSLTPQQDPPVGGDAGGQTPADGRTTEPAEELISVMIIDDDPAMRLLARRVIETSSAPLHVLAEFASGSDAIDHVVRRRPDLVLCDVMMPDLSGPEVVKEVHLRNPSQAFIFWSATATEALERHRDELGVPFVSKDHMEQLPGLLVSLATRPDRTRAQG